MKAVILTCYESNEERVKLVYETCLKKGYEVSAIGTDFSHFNKIKRNNLSDDFIYIDTIPYSKNLSIKRMYSHYRFAKDAFDKVGEIKPDLIWLMIPANSLVRQASIYKNNNLDVKIVIDVIDMWPESLPVSINKNILPFNIWRNLRSKYIGCGDYLVSECDLYQDILRNEYKKDIKTIYWSSDKKVGNGLLKNNDNLSLCYLGSINNIIDIDVISDIISNIDEKVTLHVIGEGENRINFVETLSKVCEVIYHGEIRDEDKKAEIFKLCHAGLNIYKKNLYIGLTVKCIDYFRNGLPLINNIEGDTKNMLDKYDLGINYDNSVIDIDRIKELRRNNKHILEFYNKNFSKESFINKCNDVIDEVLK